jgi:hypothetical protein
VVNCRRGAIVRVDLLGVLVRSVHRIDADAICRFEKNTTRVGLLKELRFPTTTAHELLLTVSV